MLCWIRKYFETTFLRLLIEVVKHFWVWVGTSWKQRDSNTVAAKLFESVQDVVDFLLGVQLVLNLPLFDIAQHVTQIPLISIVCVSMPG